MEIEMFSRGWGLVVTVTAVWDRKRMKRAIINGSVCMITAGSWYSTALCPDLPIRFILRLKGPETRRRHSGAPNHWTQLLLS